MKKLIQIIVLLIFATVCANSQQIQSASEIKCGFNPNHNYDETAVLVNNEIKLENQVFSVMDSSECSQHYVIPVVFHVFTDDAANKVPLFLNFTMS